MLQIGPRAVTDRQPSFSGRDPARDEERAARGVGRREQKVGETVQDGTIRVADSAGVGLVAQLSHLIDQQALVTTYDDCFWMLGSC